MVHHGHGCERSCLGTSLASPVKFGVISSALAALALAIGACASSQRILSSMFSKLHIDRVAHFTSGQSFFKRMYAVNLDAFTQTDFPSSLRSSSSKLSKQMSSATVSLTSSCISFWWVPSHRVFELCSRTVDMFQRCLSEETVLGDAVLASATLRTRCQRTHFLSRKTWRCEAGPRCSWLLGR